MENLYKSIFNNPFAYTLAGIVMGFLLRGFAHKAHK
jgi:hypothetical protein